MELFSYDELAVHIDNLNEEMDSESRFSGIIAIVLGIFPKSNKVSNFLCFSWSVWRDVIFNAHDEIIVCEKLLLLY